jgi:hypothetical protein
MLSAMMQRRRVLTVGFVVFVLVAVVVGYVSAKRAAARTSQRDAFYRASLQSYSEALPLGMTRKDVEAYLRAQGKPFRQLCCMETLAKNALDDLTKIGVESHPWYCSAHDVYIGFQFVSVEPHRPWEARESDILAKVMVYHWLEGCL